MYIYELFPFHLNSLTSHNLVFTSSESSLGDLLLGKLGDSLFIGFLLNVSFLGGGEDFDVAVGRKVS